MDNLFVYGMLLFEDEEPSHGIETRRYVLDSHEAWVEGDLFVVEGFPFLVPEGDNKVRGKLLECKEVDTLLQKYDVIQGANQSDPFFERVEVEAILEDGERKKAHCYIGGRNLCECFAKDRYKVDSGDFLDSTP